MVPGSGIMQFAANGFLRSSPVLLRMLSEDLAGCFISLDSSFEEIWSFSGFEMFFGAQLSLLW